MHLIRRLASCTLLAAAATLAACSDAPTAGTDAAEPASQVVAAANANAGPDASVVKIGTGARSAAAVVATASVNPTGKNFIDPPTAAAPYPITQPCYATMPSESGETSAAYYNDPCNPDPCGGDPSCGDPCYYGCNPPPPPPLPAATFNYGSDATPVSFIPGTTLKTLQLISFSQAISNVGFTTLDASFKNVGAQWSCYNTPGQFDSSHASGYGSPLYLQTSREPAWQGVIRWQVDGTHGFTPVSGASGGGTFWSSDFTCG